MRYRPILGLVIILLFSILVFATSNAPPPIPTEYWGVLRINGNLAPNGTPVSYFNGEEWINTTTLNEWYSIIMTGGDSDLTDPNDPSCEEHRQNQSACIPCNDTDANPDNDCVEGPQEGDMVNIIINNTPVSVRWNTLSNRFDINTTGGEIPPDTYRFHLTDSNGNIVAWFGDLGNVLLKGSLEQSSSYTSTGDNEFKVQNSNGNDQAIINLNNGNMYIKGLLSENQNNLAMPEHAFVVQDASGAVVSYIDDSGNLVLKGGLYQNVDNP